MKSYFFLTGILFIVRFASGQINCIVFETGDCKKSCEYYNRALNYPQGSRQSQSLFDSAIYYCPSFAEAYREKSVPFLKRGLFMEWKKIMDKAVDLNPRMYIGIRGWCLFKFLKDYKNALSDFVRLDSLANGKMGTSGDGEYPLRILMALSKREVGDCKGALSEFDKSISASEKNNSIGRYDYLLRGITKLKCMDLSGALADFEKQNVIYSSLADTYYYTGQVYLLLKKQDLADRHFIKAKELFKGSGYHRQDPYCSLLDEVSLADVESVAK